MTIFPEAIFNSMSERRHYETTVRELVKKSLNSFNNQKDMKYIDLKDMVTIIKQSNLPQLAELCDNKIYRDAFREIVINHISSQSALIDKIKIVVRVSSKDDAIFYFDELKEIGCSKLFIGYTMDDVIVRKKNGTIEKIIYGIVNYADNEKNSNKNVKNNNINFKLLVQRDILLREENIWAKIVDNNSPSEIEVKEASLIISV